MTRPSSKPFPSVQRQLLGKLRTAVTKAKKRNNPFIRAVVPGDMLHALHAAKMLAARGHGVAVTLADVTSLVCIYILTGPPEEYVLGLPTGERKLYANPPDLLDIKDEPGPSAFFMEVATPSPVMAQLPPLPLATVLPFQKPVHRKAKAQA